MCILCLSILVLYGPLKLEMPFVLGVSIFPAWHCPCLHPRPCPGRLMTWTAPCGFLRSGFQLGLANSRQGTKAREGRKERLEYLSVPLLLPIEVIASRFLPLPIYGPSSVFLTVSVLVTAHRLTLQAFQPQLCPADAFAMLPCETVLSWCHFLLLGR